jgi:hypothetical protein
VGAGGKPAPLPLVVKCTNEREAEEVFKLQQTIFSLFDASDDPETVARTIYKSTTVSSTLTDNRPFYCVVSAISKGNRVRFVTRTFL